MLKKVQEQDSLILYGLSNHIDPVSLFWILVLTTFLGGESTTLIRTLLTCLPLHLGLKEKLEEPPRHLPSRLPLIGYEVS